MHRSRTLQGPGLRALCVLFTVVLPFVAFRLPAALAQEAPVAQPQEPAQAPNPEPAKPEDTAKDSAPATKPPTPAAPVAGPADEGRYETTVSAAREEEADAEAERFDIDLVQTPTHGTRMVVTEDQIQEMNAPNSEDTLRYVPSVYVRKRFIGDRNAPLAIRGQSEFQTARNLVYADGLLLSNLLQTTFNGSPRWFLVAPEEIVSTEVLYGPFSAAFPGNSLNGVVNLHTRMPEDLQVAAEGSYYLQKFEMYGTDDTFVGNKEFVSIGDRLGKFSYYAFFNRLENDAQPMSFLESTALTPATVQPRVTGVHADKNPRGLDRFVFGSSGPTHTTAETGKIKLAYDLSDDVRVWGLVGYAHSYDEREAPENYLRNAAGAKVWTGTVQFNGSRFTVNPAVFNIEDRDRSDIQYGFGVDADLGHDWAVEAVGSWLDVIHDERRGSNRNPEDPGYTAAGRVDHFGDTGWRTADLKVGTNRLLDVKGLGFFAGYHFDEYFLEFKQFNSVDWSEGARTAMINANGGKTTEHAAFAQFDWEFVSHWTATLGARAEWWNAEDGFLSDGVRKAEHPDRHDGEVSPKFALTWRPDDDWTAKVALARAVRNPVVAELFQGRVDPATGAISSSDPNLAAEDSFSKLIEIERAFEGGRARLSFFEDDVEDAIFTQQGIVGATVITSFQNITRVRTRGIEVGFESRGLLLDDLDLEASATYMDAPILEDKPNPSVEGNRFPRIPEWRASLLATYHVTDAWNVSLGGRYSGQKYGDLDNDDTNGRTWGGQSEFLLFDAKTSYQVVDQARISFGVENLLNEDYFSFHPMPQRTFYLDVNLKF